VFGGVGERPVNVPQEEKSIKAQKKNGFFLFISM